MREGYIRNHSADIKGYASVIENRLDDRDCTMEDVFAGNARMLELVPKYTADHVLIDNKYNIPLKFQLIGRLSSEGKRPFSRSKTNRLRTFPHSARFSAMMQIHQRKHCFKEESVMRHVYIRGILALIWLAAAAVSGVSGNLEWTGLYILMGAAFGYSAYASWKKEKNDKRGC